MTKAQLYCITHLPSGKKYVGMTWGKNMSYKRRFNSHMKGKGGIYIKKLIDEGCTKKDFSIELLEENDLYNIRKREAEMSYLYLYPKGLNGNIGKLILLTEDVKKKAQYKRNKKMDITRKKISSTLKNFYKTEEGKSFIKKLSKLHTGRKISEETRKKLLGRKISEETRKKLLGRKLSEETKRKISEATKGEKSYMWGRHLSYNTRKLISEANKRRIFSDEDRKNISKGVKKYIENLSYSERIERLNNSLRNCDEIKRGISISKGKKGKKTNQQEIMKQKYKLMSDEEFKKWSSSRLEWVIKRAERLRYE